MWVVLLFSKEVTLDNSWDVIVAGGGPSGCTAAAAAAREGKKVLLIESTGCLGGMGTAGLVPAWCPFSDEEKIIYKGLAERVFSETCRQMPHVAVRKDYWDWVPIDAEVLKRVYDELLQEFGVTVLFHTQVCHVDAADGRVTDVIVSNKGGLYAYAAQVYVDCTGDADLAVWAGADYSYGDEEGDVQAGSMCFTLANVDPYYFEHHARLHPMYPESPIYQIIKDDRYPDIKDLHLCDALIGPGVIGFNAGHIWDVDTSDPFCVSRAQMKGRQMAKQFRDALAAYQPDAFAGAHLVNTAPLVGIRETRRIHGLYTLTAEDFLERRSFEDEIARNCYYIDIHQKPSKDGEQQTEKKNINGLHYKPGESHGIPYRCLIPQGLQNVLVAGRSISCDHVVQGSVRVMPVCLVTGEAAGVAAAMAAQDHAGAVAQVDVQTLRRKLVEYGAYIH